MPMKMIFLFSLPSLLSSAPPSSWRNTLRINFPDFERYCFENWVTVSSCWTKTASVQCRLTHKSEGEKRCMLRCTSSSSHSTPGDKESREQSEREISQIKHTGQNTSIIANRYFWGRIPPHIALVSVLALVDVQQPLEWPAHKNLRNMGCKFVFA